MRSNDGDMISNGGKSLLLGGMEVAFVCETEE